ncbi:azurin [Shewanella fidelis]|uniref:Azurin n=1 Tax=Shewanella fidelis TaxID=173509 RepID=A0AAW8NHC6_9GAMM|nr:azurin [Shewanella fidelis]MDR8522752.1 azurin [Shewanella fidelis]MDW4812367.1 azurin [Shewanella fidelis]MDW4815968.1 azurin [Shewanella fidelis]MDW4820608.1 azurin [Shewanella fidelis]MDW4824831.1 azurin [Shewanella fidelis]
MYTLLKFTLAALLLSFAQFANANTCQLDINATDAMQFDKKELTLPAGCTEVTLNLHHTGTLPKSAMGHNWVLTETANMSAVANEGMAAGAANSYVKADDPRVLAHTDIIGGGESTSITFSTADLDPAKQYSFFCSFPGHWAIMQGQFVIAS